MAIGTLFLIPTTISEGTITQVLPSQLFEIINTIDEYIVENERNARRFLKEAGLKIPQDKLFLHVLDKHAKNLPYATFLKNCMVGKKIGLLSDAGCPAIADPGAEVVLAAHKLKIKVLPLVGPSSILLALMSSGFNGQSFTFNGYLPIDKPARIKKIKELEKQSKLENQTQLFIETPFRNKQLFEELVKTCSLGTFMSICCDATGVEEYIFTATITDWKKIEPPIQKKPAIFSIYCK